MLHIRLRLRAVGDDLEIARQQRLTIQHVQILLGFPPVKHPQECQGAPAYIKAPTRLNSKRLRGTF